ncbi:hypothetical protein G6F45_014287 [Rhizopus arrhizus]|nr:hypothetical protein G6F45_014287 [Rhizopus arrhizus]
MASAPTELSKRGVVKLLKPATGTEAEAGAGARAEAGTGAEAEVGAGAGTGTTEAGAEAGTTVDDDPAMLIEILALLGALLGTLMGVATRRDIF